MGSCAAVRLSHSALRARGRSRFSDLAGLANRCDGPGLARYMLPPNSITAILTMRYFICFQFVELISVPNAVGLDMNRRRSIRLALVFAKIKKRKRVAKKLSKSLTANSVDVAPKPTQPRPESDIFTTKTS